MTGDELADLRTIIGEAVFGERLSLSQTARLVGLEDPDRNGSDKIRKWEREDGPTGPVAVILEEFEGVANPTLPSLVRLFLAQRIRDRLNDS